MTQIIYPNLSYAIQGAFFDVYNALHHLELSEAGWEQALLIALAERGLEAQEQVEYHLHYKEKRIGLFFVDVVVDDKVLVELKAASQLYPIDQAQVLTYLRITDLKIGILVNFGGDKLEFQRIPNFLDKQPQIASPIITPATNTLRYAELSNQLRAILYEVHHELGPGFMHMHYRRATQVELRWHDIPYEVKKQITISFRGRPVETRETKLLIVDESVLLVVVAVNHITSHMKTRLRQYLRLLDLKLGLIANFHSPTLEIETRWI